VLNWLEQRSPGPIAGIIAGGRQDAGLHATLSVCGMPLPVSGRLAITGVGPFDESFFLSFDTLADVVSFCRASTAAGTPPIKSEIAAPVAADHAELCSPNLPPDRVSAFLLQLSPQAKPEAVKFSLAQLPNVKIVEGNTVLTSSRQALRTLLLAIAVFTALQLVALLILVSLLFSAIIRERHREVGLLRAMGARPGQVMMIILTEAVIITGLAGVAGLALGAALLLMFARSLGLYFGLLGVPFSWPPLAVLQVSAMIAVAFSVGLGLVGALLPAWRLRRITPYGLIHSQAD